MMTMGYWQQFYFHFQSLLSNSKVVSVIQYVFKKSSFKMDFEILKANFKSSFKKKNSLDVFHSLI